VKTPGWHTASHQYVYLLTGILRHIEGGGGGSNQKREGYGMTGVFNPNIQHSEGLMLFFTSPPLNNTEL